MEKKETITDLSYLMDASENNEEFVSEMIGIFLRQTPSYLNEINQATRQEEWDKLKVLLHKLKPTLPMMGIKEGESLVKIMEADAKAKINLSEIKTNLVKLEALCEQAYAELKSR